MIKKILWTGAILACLALASGVLLWNQYQQFLKTPLNINEPITFNLEKGSSFYQLTNDLLVLNILKNEHFFKLYGRRSGLAQKIKAGEYQLTASMTPVELLEKLVKGDVIKYQFTIIEGTRFSELAAQLVNEPTLIDELSELDPAALIDALPLSVTSPEGMFLAETYQYIKGTSNLSILKMAASALQKKLDEQWQNKDPDLPYKSAYEGLIMASIIEKETGLAAERPIISGVFVRRLHKGMRLQTDPTVIYGMGESYQGNIRRKDLRAATAYNTYVIPALPPTPIALVGPEAIEAAFNPSDGDALYFVAKGDGSHQFSKTLQEHNKAVRTYQLKR